VLFLIVLYFISDLAPFRDLPLFRGQIGGAALVIAGFLMFLPAVGQFRSAGTQVAPTSATNNQLVTAGLYKFTRNPMYVGMIAIALGVAFWFGRPLMFLAPVLIFVITNWIFIPFEEAKMRRQFGASFDAYAQRVRRWL
jgi:protein-S-isoprenylcysteine O-methyltransferase Ste14